MADASTTNLPGYTCSPLVIKNNHIILFILIINIKKENDIEIAVKQDKVWL